MDYHSSKNQKILADFVGKNVIHCVSILVDELARIDDNWYEELAGARSDIDFEATCENNDVNVYYNSACEGYVFTDRDGDESEVYDTYRQACEAAVGHFDLDYEYREAMEHWAVDKWFGNKLLEHGEMVIFDFMDFGAIWGRCTSGQAILLDHVVGEIAEEMEILEGQKHSWEE